MNLAASLDAVLVRHGEIEAQMSAGAAGDPGEFARLSKEYADLEPVVAGIRALKAAQAEMADLAGLIADPETDAEMKEMAEAEFLELKAGIPDMELRLQRLLLPKDEADAKNAILEIRAGTGGDEAALFAGDLYRMYQRYAEKRGWSMEALQTSDTGIGGLKEVQASVAGRNVFARLKYESGVHRVQRVPETESSGRIHTSAATVAVLPEAEDVDIQIADNDLRIDIYRSSGPGGQSVNTTDSAVRITHIPTGIVVAIQDEKSQHKNKAKALKILRARLYEAERAARHAERAAARKSQVGSGDRSERIRTYNFPQGRVTDHRIGLTLYKIDQILAGEALDEIVDALTAHDEAERLAAVGEEAAPVAPAGRPPGEGRTP